MLFFISVPSDNKLQQTEHPLHVETPSDAAISGWYVTLKDGLELSFCLKDLFHPACLARVVSLFASVAAIFMVHENDDEQRQAKR